MTLTPPAGARRFLFVVVNGGGNVPIQMSVARRLTARGHDVHVLADRLVQRHAAAAHCQFHRFAHAPEGMPEVVHERTRALERSSSITKLKFVGEHLMFGPARLHAKDVRDAVEKVRPHAIGVDCLLFGAMAAAEASRIPSAVLTHFPLHGPVEGVTPFGLGLTPARGPLGRARDRLLHAIMRRMFISALTPVNDARASLGLAPLADVMEQLLRLDRSLVFMPREFDFVPTGLPPHVVYAGPQLDDPPLAGTPAPAASSPRDRPLVVLSLGSTYQAQEAPFARAVQALGTLPVHGVATYGLIDPPTQAPPANVTVTQWAPHGELLPRAAAVVCHGGLGTLMKTLSHGVPVVVLPLGRDQKDNAARVQAFGAGVWLSANSSPATIAGAVRRVLEEPRYRQSAQRMAQVIARDVAEDRAVRELEGLAG